MISRRHLQENPSELHEVLTFPGFERVLLEEWDDVLEQVLLAADPISHAVAMVPANHATTEIGLQGVQHLHIAFVLHDGELRKNLKPGAHLGMLVDPDMKTSFTIHETADPSWFEIHRLVPNVKSLRVPEINLGPSLRIVPMSAGLLLPGIHLASTERLSRSFPHMVGFY